jgi:hypothetical protein
MQLYEWIQFPEFVGKTHQQMADYMSEIVQCLDGTQCPRWTSMGFPMAPTVSDIAQAEVDRANRIEIERFHTDVWSKLLSSGGSKSQLKSVVAEW